MLEIWSEKWRGSPLACVLANLVAALRRKRRGLACMRHVPFKPGGGGVPHGWRSLRICAPAEGFGLCAAHDLQARHKAMSSYG